MNKEEIRQEFLIKFVSHLIINTAIKAKKQLSEELTKKISERMIKEDLGHIMIKPIKTSIAPKVNLREIKVPMNQVSREIIANKNQKSLIKTQPSLLTMKIMQRPPRVLQNKPSFQNQMVEKFSPQAKIAPSPPSPELIITLGMPKIDNILSDPLVETLECTGPGKNIVVSKGGRMYSMDVTLYEEEIKKIMQEISEKTRIPLLSGVFKAAYGNYIITSVMSDFIGTRFMIQKKSLEKQTNY
ncbi:MAG: hypothetical protein AABW65_02350 [Nanoarchaeota archaeon]